MQILQRAQRLNFSSPDAEPEKLEIARNNLISQRLQLLEEDKNLPAQELTLNAVIKKLTDINTGLLIYHITSENSFVFAIADSTAKIVKLPINSSVLFSSIDSLMSPFYNASKSPISEIPFHASISYRLYKLLIKPVEEKITLPSNLLIIPDRDLAGMPFEMLLTEPPEKSKYKPTDPPNYAGFFLLHKYPILYSPFIWLEMDSKEKYSENPEILVFANPTFPKSQQANYSVGTSSRSGKYFGPLYYTEDEANNIQKLHPNTTIYIRENATKKSFLNNVPDYQILHLATHAFFDLAFDAFSGLVLAAGNDSTDAGLLQGFEIADMNLENYDLVTLSACESGRGHLARGEGLLGLPRSFLGAGAKRVVMTSWKIDDRFSSLLMTQFYNNMLNKGFPTAKALQQAKISLLKEKDKKGNLNFQHPLFWAAFSIYGKPEVYQNGILPLWMKIISAVLVFLVLIILVILSKKSYRKVKFIRN